MSHHWHFFVISILNLLFPYRPETILNSIWITTGCYLISAIVLPKISAYLLVERKYYILPVVVTVFVVAMSLVFFTRVDYSRSALIYGGIISFLVLYFTYSSRVSAFSLICDSKFRY